MIDLHLHSTYSDGTYSPQELISLASKRSLSALSITDHDTIEATEPALRLGLSSNVTIIPGVELSVYHGDVHFHLLGYNYDHSSADLRQRLELVQQSRDNRNREIIQKLQSMGIDISEAELRSVSSQGQTGRPHIARLLVTKKVVKTINQAFTYYLRKGACAYIPRFIFSAQEAIDLLHNAGGLAVLAHPAQITYSISILRNLIHDLGGCGLDGIEVFYPSQKGSFRKKLSLLAEEEDLLVTGGSDYHGDVRSGTSMAGGNGLNVPDSIITEIIERTKRNKENKRKETEQP